MKINSKSESDEGAGVDAVLKAINSGVFSDVNNVNLGKDLIEKAFNYKLSPIAIESKGDERAPDFVQYDPDNKVEVLLDIKGWRPLLKDDIQELETELRKLIEIYEPHRLVLLVFHSIDRDLRSELERSIPVLYKRTDFELMIFDIYWILNILNENRDIEKKYFFKISILDVANFPEPLDQDHPGPDNIIHNQLKKSVIDNDSADYENDLLGFENDLRAFASTIALRETKPPLAIALMGNWGTGKSFFMQNLEKKVDYLSRHQKFPSGQDENGSVDETDGKQPYCQGIVQIKFNAWSYLDANLWAGLVVNIFEKLDQYITERTKGEEEKIKAQKKLSEKLSIVSDEKETLLTEGNQLAKDKTKIEEELGKMIRGKDDLYQSVIDRSAADLKREAKKKAEELLSGIKPELEKYGITADKIETLSPSDLLEEAKSWIYFFRNLGKFTRIQLALFIGIFVILIYLWFFPFRDLPKELTSSIIKAVVTTIAIIAPVLNKIYSSIKNFRKIIAPLKDYKDKFNKSFDEIKMEYEKNLVLLNSQIAEKNVRIKEIEQNLKDADSKIEYYNYALKHSITKRAFTSFIQERSHDMNYQNYLGLISIIRRDFEVLSELFQKIEIPEKISASEKQKLREKKIESDAFRENFEKPLERIVLYIDDLDRCPDDKVLEVLQAVHLLMAFPLFIVVVGVDKRCVYNALNYKNLIQYSKYTESKHPEDLKKFGINIIQPNEYLEKIFQISFHLKEATSNDIMFMIKNMLDKQVEIPDKSKSESNQAPSVTAQNSAISQQGIAKTGTAGTPSPVSQTSGTTSQASVLSVNIEDLKISEKELSFLRDISWLAGNRPRTIKRFINIYRLIRTHEQLSYDAVSRENDFLTIMFILAIVIGPYKAHAHNLFRNLETKTNSRLSTNLPKNDVNLDFIRNEISKYQTIKHILSFKGAQFNKYLTFIKRFSFEYED